MGANALNFSSFLKSRQTENFQKVILMLPDDENTDDDAVTEIASCVNRGVAPGPKIDIGTNENGRASTVGGTITEASPWYVLGTDTGWAACVQKG